MSSLSSLADSKVWEKLSAVDHSILLLPPCSKSRPGQVPPLRPHSSPCLCAPHCCTCHAICSITYSLSAFPIRLQTPWGQCLTKSRCQRLLVFFAYLLSFLPKARSANIHFLSFLGNRPSYPEHQIPRQKVIKTTTNKTTSSSSPGDRTSQWRTRGDHWEELLGKPDKGSKHSRVAFVLWSLFPLFLPAAWNLATMVAVPVAIVWAWGNPADRSKH